MSKLWGRLAGGYIAELRRADINPFHHSQTVIDYTGIEGHVREGDAVHASGNPDPMSTVSRPDRVRAMLPEELRHRILLGLWITPAEDKAPVMFSTHPEALANLAMLAFTAADHVMDADGILRHVPAQDLAAAVGGYIGACESYAAELADALDGPGASAVDLRSGWPKNGAPADVEPASTAANAVPAFAPVAAPEPTANPTENPSGTAGTGPATNLTLTQPSLGAPAAIPTAGTNKTGGPAEIGAAREGTVDGRRAEPVPAGEASATHPREQGPK